MQWKKRNAWVQLRLRKLPNHPQLLKGLRHLQQRETQRAWLPALPNWKPPRLHVLEAAPNPTKKDPWN